MRLLFRSRSKPQPSHSIRDYQRVVRKKLKAMPQERSLALAQAIGAETMENFVAQGDGHVAVLRHYGLSDGMAIYDLGCGCGRTAQALQRSGWQGDYTGADVVPELLQELQRQCPTYQAIINYKPTIVAPDSSLDMTFNWSVFTHLYPTESYLYIQDSFRALKPGGKLVFSFLELAEPAHDRIWNACVDRVRRGERAEQLDCFLHRDWIARFAKDAGFLPPVFTGGLDDSNHPAFWQALAMLEKPA
ncbi:MULTISPECIES: bifunctional 2-polyprenyl-6-hydroxyphenol methylase/3-demethylubiquinol 3-O-methyltransferase UbiG [Novosphingobium]|uniref:class I SAM-dependent methyltransferase n=1 Tax=Novosphingobium TaxID=165696 RepID=UPI000788DAD2|nr:MULTISPECIES: class I SAM-dependent methyltransferase [Novosphingobium]WQD92698.1 class I SAM-dependent methyltransferase [Novosphingobium capsulatum]